MALYNLYHDDLEGGDQNRARDDLAGLREVAETRATARPYVSKPDKSWRSFARQCETELSWLATRTFSGVPVGQRGGRDSDKPTIYVTMGRGVAVDLHRFIVRSEDFSSCSPVVLFNASTGRGALFHFPAKALAVEEQRYGGTKFNELAGPTKEFLTTLYQDVSPTEIHLAQRPNQSAGDPFVPNLEGGGQDPADLEAFFRKDCSFTGGFCRVPKQGSNWYSVTAADAATLVVLPLA